MQNIIRLMTIATGLFLAPAWGAEPGEKLADFTLEDQHGEERSLSDAVRRIYANNSRAADKLMKQAMKELDQSVLDRQQAIVVADVSGAPGFVKRIIRSSLKDRSYLTWMDTRGSTRSILPYREDRISVIDLAQRRITGIRYLGSVEELRAALSAPPEATPDAKSEGQ